MGEVRKIIQIAVTGVNNNPSTQCHSFIVALCNDGTLWLGDEYLCGRQGEESSRVWSEIFDVPQDFR